MIINNPNYYILMINFPAIPLVKNGAHYVVGNIENKRALLSLQEHGRHLLDCVRRLGEGLDAANHPDILSPLRRGQQTQTGRSHVRSRDIQDDTGTVKVEIFAVH